MRKTAKKTIILALILCLTLTLFAMPTAQAAGTEYHVGMGDAYDYRTITDVPLDNLKPGDKILIHAPEDGRPFLIDPGTGINFRQDGTKANPISIIGIANKKGEKPILQDANIYTPGTHNLFLFYGNHYVLDNFVIYGTLNLFLQWVNGEEVACYTAAGELGAQQNPLGKPLYGRKLALSDMAETVNGIQTCQAPGFEGLRLMPRRNAGDACVAKVWGGSITYRIIAHRNDDLTVRNCNVFAGKMGILSADTGSGSLLVEDSEFGYIGHSAGDNGIYLTSDPSMYPNAVVRVQNCYIHETVSGHGLKSRATRTEVYYNYLYNNASHSLELIGPDPGFSEDNDIFNNVGTWMSNDPAMASQFTFREDADVVGNVIYHTHTDADLSRVGADSTSWVWEKFEVTDPITRPLFGTSFGRYRFVNNTFVDMSDGYGDGDAHRGVKVQFGVESVEFYNNIFYSPNPGTFAPVAEALGGIELQGKDGNMYYNADPNAAMWASGERRIGGANNWVVRGAVDTQWPRALDRENPAPEDTEHIFYNDCVPNEWSNTMYGSNPGFVDAANGDFRIRPGSPVSGSGLSAAQTVYQWPDWKPGLALPRYDWASGTLDYEVYAKRLTTPKQKDNAFPNPLTKISYSAVTPGAVGSGQRVARSDNGSTLGAYATVPGLPSFSGNIIWH